MQWISCHLLALFLVLYRLLDENLLTVPSSQFFTYDLLLVITFPDVIMYLVNLLIFIKPTAIYRVRQK